MCTQVGVGGLVVGYTIVGAFGFIIIETSENLEEPVCNPKYIHTEYADKLWFSTASNKSVNILDQTAFYVVTNSILQRFQENITINKRNKLNCDGKTPSEIWTFPAALMFCLSVITMIGYGTLVPKTPWGKGATVIYAVVGIPLYVLYFLNMGKVLAQTFKWLYTRLHECTGQRKPGQRIIVPSTACLWVIFGYIVVGSIMYSMWEEWDYLDSTYFCVISLSKIGFGDLVPGWSSHKATKDNQTKLIINFVYLLLGMGLIAMCYNLMKEEVFVKARELKEQLNQVMDAVHYKLMKCCKSESLD